MPNVQPLLRGRPVLVMRAGLYPNKADIVDVMAAWPKHSVMTEALRSSDTDEKTRFCVTVRPK